MPVAQKTSKKSSVVSTRGISRKARSDELSRLMKELRNVFVHIGKLKDFGVTLVVQVIHHPPRRPLPEYTKVVAVGADDEVGEVRGHTGVVLDAAEEDGRWTYTVYFPSQQETFVLHEASLWDSGETIPEDVIYGGGETRRVKVDAFGNGTLVV